jgi:hypothetical protein
LTSFIGNVLFVPIGHRLRDRTAARKASKRWGEKDNLQKQKQNVLGGER